MANQQQKRRDAKQAKRRKLSKDKAKAVRRIEHQAAHFMANLSEDKADQIKHKNIYDILNDGQEMKRRKKAGEATTEMFTNVDLLKGVNSMITMTIKLHSGVAVYLKLVDEKRFEPTEVERELINAYERTLVEFTEDVAVVITLDQAKKQPVDYPEIVIHISDVMHTMMFDFRDKIIALLETQRDLIEAYAQEHKPEADTMHQYMSELHETRIHEVIPMYATGAAAELLADLESLAAAMEDDGEPVDDLENLAPVDPDDESIVAVQPPQDPVSETQA